ncbi:electron transfer flavoprotein subunit beta/FixA family protein [Geosporobacter ferrireducens]|uniref:Electron transfer flavoprotein small subunit n=1 Tax=Geosporobacter ferrireducens TaxID=1424294 RepID=A0A1D8GFX8_9FIRM|nr:electron transfer flavoprotein subunit beta/FixA family protein [Geosporobacter ferrireducens]AOT69817.1 electron transfer flavoprotein subunit beta [Geosporobacter ferrireducens]
MKIIVCMKQVPDTNDIKIDPKTGTMIRDGVPSIINPDDRNGLEEALALKDKLGGSVTVISMGPPQAEIALKEALAMGADEAILLSDRVFSGADSWATSLTLALAVKKIENYDLIICGRQAIDGDTAQVGPELAEHLDLPQVSYVRKVVSVDADKIVVERALEDGYEVIECQMPAILTAVKELNIPRYPSMGGIVEAFRNKSITVWNNEAIGGIPQELGLKGSPTKVKRSFTPSLKGAGKMLEGTPKEVVKVLVQELKEKQAI